MPGQIQPGIASESLVESIDIYPTLCELCNVSPNPNIEGQSFSDVLLDPAAESKQTAYSFLYKSSNAIARTLRTTDHRLIVWGPLGTPDHVELYDYSSDPDGKQNVADQYPGTVDLLIDIVSGL